jgi:exopolysaccharide production protein ExoQ
MPPVIASVVFALGILALFRLERPAAARVSPALWLPVAWVSLCASRAVTQWLQMSPTERAPEMYLEGSPLDRLFLTALLLAGLLVLLSRGARATQSLKANAPILLFFGYAAVSVLWSDYPDVAFKRWTKALGDIVMVLVVLTDSNPYAALRRLFTRTAFVLIPLSVLFIKYYPQLGRMYSPWTGAQFYGGVATTKNGLGLLCLAAGLASVWAIIQSWRRRQYGREWGPVIAHGTVLLMILWLFWKANSATALACFVAGGALIVVSSFRVVAREPRVVHALLWGVAFLCLSALFLDAGTNLVQGMGRDVTLTGRTLLWADVLRMQVDPLFGAGFESFWLGDRAEWFWNKYWWQPNQSHNGYIEIFVNLGWIGVLMVGFFMVWGYRNIAAAYRQNPSANALRLGFFVAAALYNLTEAGFKTMHLAWIVLLLAVAVAPAPRLAEER